jgi:hypothetical protein
VQGTWRDYNFNKDNGFMLSQAWYPVINLFQKRKGLEGNKAGLSNTTIKQKMETDCPGEGLG